MCFYLVVEVSFNFFLFFYFCFGSGNMHTSDETGRAGKINVLSGRINKSRAIKRSLRGGAGRVNTAVW